ncbi:MAG: type IV secretion system DNA-binding domain-containing protein, partial [Gammaproteobacteria bacterium]
VTAYTQTVNDLGAVFGTNPHKHKMLLGNFGTVIMLRIANLDTARTFTECLQAVQTRSGLPTTTSQDKSFGENGELFSTSNTDTIQQEKQQLVVENDLFSLPQGQAFVLTQGGKVYKIRIPLPANNENKEANIAALMQEVNLRN